MIKELQSFFRKHHNVYTTKPGITLELVSGTGITAAIGLGFEAGESCKAKLLTDPVDMAKFIEAYKLKSIEDLDKILQHGMLWIRYLIGKAAVSYEVADLDATFTFRVVNSKTIIYCHRLHFFDENDVLFTMEHYIEDYIIQNKAMLEMAAQRRMEWVSK